MRLAEPEGVLSFLGYATDVGLIRWYLYPSLAVLVGLILVEWKDRAPAARAFGARLFAHSAYLLLAVSLAQLIVQGLKRLFGRARPPLLDEYGSLSFVFGRSGEEFYSFPSGHSATMAVVTTTLMMWFPQVRLPILAAGTAFALSRIVVGAHYPSDVAAGLAIGFLTAILLGRWFARQRLGYRFLNEGKGTPGLLPVRRCSSVR